MLARISKSDIADFAAMLKGCDYIESKLTLKLGSAKPPTAAELPRMLFETREATAENALIRLFLIGSSLEEELVRDSLSHTFIEMCLHNRLLEPVDGRLRATIVIVAFEGLLFASDALYQVGTDGSSDFVLPASTDASSYLSKLVDREGVERTLDLGCGCGVHALLAARHSEQVIATDSSDFALRYTAFNASLNDIKNVECRQGNLFEPVANDAFDLIISNPPFVMGPEQRFTYRDSPAELDGFCRQIVQLAPAYLRDGGKLQMLCEWAEIEGQPWQERLEEWIKSTGCDAWVLRSPSRDPASYVAGRTTDLSGDGVETGATFDDWLAYFVERNVRAIHPGMLLLRRRQGRNWFQVRSMIRTPAEAIGDAIAKNVMAQDFLQDSEDDESLLDAVFGLSRDLQLEQRFTRSADSWSCEKGTLRLAGSLPMETEVDLPILAFLNQLDGQRTLGVCIADFCRKTGAAPGALTPQLLAAMRLFISNGFAEPSDVK